MPDPSRILKLLHQATIAQRTTPGRIGRLVRMENATDVLAVGDLHGNVANFQLVLKLADLARQPGRHLVLQELIHGPHKYPGGGDKSHQLLDLYAALKCQYPARVHFLPGNHEFAQATDRPIARAEGELNALFRAGVFEAYRDAVDEVLRAYAELIFAAPLALRTENRVFLCHSLPTASVLDHWDVAVLTADELPRTSYTPEGAVYQLVWGRDVSADNVARFLQRVDADWLITGHLPCPEGFQLPNDRQVVLDCQESPGGVCLVPADQPITPDALRAGVFALQ